MRRFSSFWAGLLALLLLLPSTSAWAQTYTQIYNSASVGNFDTPGGPVAAGETVGGLTELTGGWASVSDNILSVFGTRANGYTSGGYVSGQSYYDGAVTVPGSDAQLNSKQTARLSIDGNGNASVGMIARSKSVLEPYTRQVHIVGMFTYNPSATGEAPRFSVSVMGSGADNIDETTEQSASWYDPAHPENFEFILEVTGTNPTTATFSVKNLSTGLVVRSITTTTNASYIQTPGKCGLLNGSIHGLMGAGPTKYTAYTVSIAPAVSPLTATMTPTVNNDGTASIAVTPANGPGTGVYTAKVYAVQDSVSFTPSGSNQIGSSVDISPGSTGTLSIPLAAGVYKGVKVQVSRDVSTVLATTNPSDARAKSDYLILQGAKPTPGALPAIDAAYSNGVAVMVAGNSFLGHTTDSNGFTTSIKSYLQANGFASGSVKTSVLGFPGSALGRDWGASSAVYSAGMNGPTGAGFGAYGIEGDRTSKNLLANLIDRTTAFSAANPGLPVIVIYYEMTNNAQNNLGATAAASEFADIKAACASRNWKLVLEGPAWITPQPGYSLSFIDLLFTSTNACRALCTGNTASFGDDTWLAYSFATASTTYYGGQNDGSGVHPSYEAVAARGTVWGENLRRGLMASQVAPIASITVSPATIALTSGQTSQTFVAVAKDSTGTALSVQPTFTWTSGAPTISSGGVLTVPTSYTITATVGSVSGTATATLPTSATPSYPSASNVRSGINRGDGTLGTLVLPVASNVLSGIGFGAGGSEFTGTATQSGGGSGLTLSQLQAELDTRGLTSAKVSSLPTASQNATALLGATLEGQGQNALTVQKHFLMEASNSYLSWDVAPINTTAHTQVWTFFGMDGLTPRYTSTVTFQSDNKTQTRRRTIMLPPGQ